ncbi:MAG: hypothetical protein KC620_15170 [Myxococcales bacterium]|nr:hypothetical protein [Myxococcales bacterium]
MDRSTRALLIVAALLVAAAIAVLVLGGGDTTPDDGALDRARASLCDAVGGLFSGEALPASDLRGPCLQGGKLRLPTGAQCTLSVLARDVRRRGARLTLTDGARVEGRFLPRGDGPQSLEAPIRLDQDADTKAGDAIDLTVYTEGGALKLGCLLGPCVIELTAAKTSACPGAMP